MKTPVPWIKNQAGKDDVHLEPVSDQKDQFKIVGSVRVMRNLQHYLLGNDLKLGSQDLAFESDDIRGNRQDVILTNHE